MRYVSFAEYRELYGGSLILSAEDWDKYEMPASYYLDILTYGRINTDNLDLRAKLAVCSAAESYFLEAEAIKQTSQTVKSFNNEGYSETKFSQDDIRKTYDSERQRGVNLYLPLSHPLRYAGI